MAPAVKNTYPWTPHKRLLFAREFIRDLGDKMIIRDSDFEEVREGLVVRHGKTFKTQPTIDDLRKERDSIRATHAFLVRHLLRMVPEKFNPNSFALELTEEEWEVLKKKKQSKAYSSAFKKIREGSCNDSMKIFHNFFGGFLNGTVDASIDVDLQDDSEDEEEVNGSAQARIMDLCQDNREKKSKEDLKLVARSISRSAVTAQPREPSVQKGTDKITIIQKPTPARTLNSNQSTTKTPFSTTETTLSSPNTAVATTTTVSSITFAGSTSKFPTSVSNAFPLNPPKPREVTRNSFKIAIPHPKITTNNSFMVYDGAAKTTSVSTAETATSSTELITAKSPFKKQKHTSSSTVNATLNAKLVITGISEPREGQSSQLTARGAPNNFIIPQNGDVTRVLINPNPPSSFQVMWQRVTELKANGSKLPSGFSVNKKLLDFISIDLTEQQVDALSKKVCLDDTRYLKVLERMVRE